MDVDVMFERQVADSRRPAIALLWRLGCPGQDIEDMFMSAVYKAWRHKDKYDDSWPFRTWLAAIVKYTWLDEMRKRQQINVVPFNDIDEETIASDAMDATSIVTAGLVDPVIEDRLSKLPIRFRDALFALAKHQNYREASRELGVKDVTLRSRVLYARRAYMALQESN